MAFGLVLAVVWGRLLAPDVALAEAAIGAGLTGALFREFAFTLAGAVLISGVVALTLSPMLASRVLTPSSGEGRFEHAVEHFFNGLAKRYRRSLGSSLDTLPVTLVFAAVVLMSIYFMFVTSKSELAPDEDQSILFFQATGPQTATLEYNEAYTREIVAAFESVPEYHESFLLLGFGGDGNVVFGGFKMEQPSQRERSQMQVLPEVQGLLSQIAGFQLAVFPRPSGASGPACVGRQRTHLVFRPPPQQNDRLP